LNGEPDVIDQMKRLSQNNAIKRIRWNVIRTCEITDECSIRVITGDMQDIADFDAVSTEALGIRSIANFEDSSLNVTGITLQKVFDIVTVNGLPAIIAKMIAEGRQAIQDSKIHGSEARGRLPSPPI
jgi:hypothetical protein